MHARQRRIIEAGIAETIDPLLRLQPAAERTNAERLGTQRAGEHGVIGIGVMRNGVDRAARVERSEEHTSELQSLMRTSYAVFCLKKKHIKTSTSRQHTTEIASITKTQKTTD